MAQLEEYRRKRDFGVTPEPSGERAAPHAGLLYFIQKHAARNLHYDFRIELDGILMSWAIPKGPSLDPSVKHLAMHVEDHPLEYGTFEGTIPKGEYGGGTVMVWDRGTWEPDHGDPREHLEQGHLKFYLHGERLKGRWMLVRTKGYGGKGGKESWLLFKEHDEEERPHSQFDPTKEWTTSVLTGRTMEQIAEGGEAVWHSSLSVEENLAALSAVRSARGGAGATTAPSPSEVAGAKEAVLPRRLEVELATLVKQPPDGDRWLHEIKLDGYRILGFLDHGKVRLVSRNGKDWTDRFVRVRRAIEALPADTALLDGEVVVLKPDGASDFQSLQNFARAGREAQLEYYAFDLLHLNGYDLRGAALEDRKRLLRAIVPESSSAVRYTDHVEGQGDAFFERACDFELEGIVSKRRDAPYRSGRGRDWLKTKCLLTQEFVVVGWTDPGGSRQQFGALVLGLHRDGKLVHAGRVGTGFTEQSLVDIMRLLEPLAREEPSVADPPTGAMGRGIHWVKPELVAEVAFAEWTAEGVPRHPSFLGLREDTSAEEVVAEKPVELPEVPAEEPGATAGGGGAGADGGAGAATETRDAPASGGAPTVAGVSLTNPDRVLWPDVPLTKLELVRHYESVADLMLPHVSGRPLSLVRCPTGYTGECFYQKHVENFPRAVGTVQVYEPEEDREVPYATVRDLAGLVGLAQMGVLEIHPWGSRNDRMDQPDRIFFDLDPDPGLPFTAVAATALLLRSELDRLGLASWLKTTGGKGLHVVVPIRRRQGWDEAKSFAKAFVDHIVSLEPRMFTSNMSKAQREGRIYIDYLRNSRGATSVAAYSTRARPGAPVSVPLFWNEIEGATERPVFTVRNLGERLRSLDGDPWGGIGDAKQSITRAMLDRLRTRVGK